MGYAVGGLALIVLALSLSIFVQTERLDATKQEKANLIAEVNVKTEESKLVAAKKEAEFTKLLNTRNADYETNLANLNNTIASLRKQRSSTNSSILPEASNIKSSYVPEGQICFDRKELDTAQRDSENEIEELLFICSKTNLQLSCGIDWIESLPKSDNYNGSDNFSH